MRLEPPLAKAVVMSAKGEGIDHESHAEVVSLNNVGDALEASFPQCDWVPEPKRTPSILGKPQAFLALGSTAYSGSGLPGRLFSHGPKTLESMNFLSLQQAHNRSLRIRDRPAGPATRFSPAFHQIDRFA